jgi:hypothetical protein
VSTDSDNDVSRIAGEEASAVLALNGDYCINDACTQKHLTTAMEASCREMSCTWVPIISKESLFRGMIYFVSYIVTSTCSHDVS